MSLSSMLRTACTLQRQTVTKDTSGGATRAWANVAGASDAPCDLQPASSAVRLQFQQQRQAVTHTLYLATDVGARAADRFVIGARTFLLIPGGYQAPAPGYGQWPAVAHVEEQTV